MFIFVSEDNCPNCGSKGKKWKENPEVMICPQCSSYFSEFGIILEPQRPEEVGCFE